MEKKIELYQVKDQTVNDAFDNMVVEVHLKKQMYGHQSFLLSGSEPGAGTTTMAINLAIAMAEAGRKTVIVDLDMRKEQKYKRLNCETEYGLAELLKENTALDSVIYETNQKNLDYIPAAGKVVENPVRLLCGNRIEQFLEELKGRYDYIFIDMPSIHSAPDAKILAGKIDGVIVVAAQGKTLKTRLKESVKSLKESGANVLGVVLNHVERVEYKHYMKYYDYFKNLKYQKTVKSKKA